MRRGRAARSGAAWAGLLVAGALILGTLLLDATTFGVAAASLTAIASGSTSWFLWRRTPFRALAWAEAVGAFESAVAAGLFLALPPQRIWSSPWSWAAAAVGVGSWWWGRERSRRRHPEAWRRWRTVAEKTGPLGYLAFQHIPPDLAGGGGT